MYVKIILDPEIPTHPNILYVSDLWFMFYEHNYKNIYFKLFLDLWETGFHIADSLFLGFKERYLNI